MNLRIRPQAINIIESLQIDDNQLVSAIGNSYGDIYETHLEWAKDSKLNHTELGDAIPDGYMEYIMPILKGKMWSLFVPNEYFRRFYQGWIIHK